MKKLYHILALALAFALVSCGEKNPPAPTDVTFPACKNQSINPGESVDLSFKADYAWELSISSNVSAYFSFDDGGVEAYRLKGEAGSAMVTVKSRPVEDLADAVTCAVTMKMEGKSAVIANITLMPKQRTLAVYSVQMASDGSFVTSADGTYSYSAREASQLHLTWPSTLSNYILPVKVTANCDWSIPETYPSWMTVSQSSGSAMEEVKINITGILDNVPEQDAEGEISFMDVATGRVIKTIKVRIDGCRDIIRFNGAPSLIDLNLLGQYNNNGTWLEEGCRFVVSSLVSAKMIALMYDDEGKLYYDEDSWVNIAWEYQNDPSSHLAIVDRYFYVTADVNTGSARNALLVMAPNYVLQGLSSPSDLIASNGTALKSSYEQYSFAMVHQGGESEGNWGNIASLNSRYEQAINGAAFGHMQESDPMYKTLSEKYGTKDIYLLEYNNETSAEYVQLASMLAVTSCTYLDADLGESQASAYLDYVEYGGGMFRMEILEFADGQQCGVVFGGEESNIAVIWCRMSSEFWPVGVYDDIYFAMYDYITEEEDPDHQMLPKDCQLYQLTSGETYEKFKDLGIPVWKLVYESEYAQRNAMIYVPPFSPEFVEVEDAGFKTMIRVESASYEVGGISKPYIHVTRTTDKNGPSSGYVVLKGANHVVFVLEVELKTL